MTKATSLIIAILFSTFAYSQVTDTVKPLHNPGREHAFGNFLSFDGDLYEHHFWTHTSFMVADTALYRVFDWVKLSNKKYVDSLRKVHPNFYYTQNRLKSRILLGVKLDPGLTNYMSGGETYGNKSYQAYTIIDKTKALVVAMGINKQNVKNYRYHIVENDSIETVHWSVPKLAQSYGAKAPYALLGEFSAFGKKLTIEVVNINDYSIRDGVVLDWKTDFRPSVREITIDGKNDYFDLMDTLENHHIATKFVANSRMPRDLRFHAGEVLTISVGFGYHGPTPYTVYLIKTINGNTDTTQVAEIRADEEEYNFPKGQYDQPGKYELIVQPFNRTDNGQLLRIPFEVLPSLKVYQQYSIRQLLPYIIGFLLVISAIFTGYHFYNKRKLNRVNQQKILANLKLSSIRSQLNPHFMFNAVTSIQNLMNQQNNSGANHYLSKFAGLTRQILIASGRELVSLEDELQLITDYLQMEQLRFGFEYSIEVAPDINKANTEIPTMLLQPFIENAARHGVSVLQGEGKIEVSIVQRQHDLILKVSDNGTGFKKAAGTEQGLGLKISTERISLLNDLYPGKPIKMEINSTTNGTSVVVTLTEWL